MAIVIAAAAGVLVGRATGQHRERIITVTKTLPAPTTQTTPTSTTVIPNTTTTATSTVPLTTTTTIATVIVPDAAGAAQQAGASAPAVQLLRQAGLQYSYSYVYVGPNGNCGLVMSQSPAPGATVPIGSTVVLTLAEC